MYCVNSFCRNRVCWWRMDTDFLPFADLPKWSIWGYGRGTWITYKLPDDFMHLYWEYLFWGYWNTTTHPPLKYFSKEALYLQSLPSPLLGRNIKRPLESPVKSLFLLNLKSGSYLLEQNRKCYFSYCMVSSGTCIFQIWWADLSAFIRN